MMLGAIYSLDEHRDHTGGCFIDFCFVRAEGWDIPGKEPLVVVTCTVYAGGSCGYISQGVITFKILNGNLICNYMTKGIQDYIQHIINYDWMCGEIKKLLSRLI